MSDRQTHSYKCSLYLRGSAEWCYGCEKNVNVKCSGLATKNDHHSDFINKHCNSLTISAKRMFCSASEGIKAIPNPLKEKNRRFITGNFAQKECEIGHRKPFLFTIGKKPGLKIVGILDMILFKTIEDNPEKRKRKDLCNDNASSKHRLIIKFHLTQMTCSTKKRHFRNDYVIPIENRMRMNARLLINERKSVRYHTLQDA